MKQQFILNPSVTQPTAEVGFIDEKQLLARLPVSRGTLGNWKTKGFIPYIKIGRRCLYDWLSVQSALQRRQRGGSLESR